MKRNKFSLSHYKLASMNMGKLVPVGLTEVLPGDTIQQATSCLVRVQPLNSPVMHPVKVKIYHFFVPHRLVWSSWENFITGGPDGMNASVFPTVDYGGGQPAVGSLADYLGVPPSAGEVGAVSALPFRGYGLIWNRFFADQDLQTQRVVSLADGNDVTTDLALADVAWEKDYFTTSRPWTQKGPQVSLPLGTSAPVVSVPGLVTTSLVRKQSDDSLQPGATLGVGAGAELGSLIDDSNPTPGARGLYLDPNGTMEADLSAATAVDVNQVRLAFALQRYEEARARYGSRYTEYLRYLGVKSSDARLQNPEFLGSSMNTIQFSEVLSTSVAATQPGPGQLYGHGIGHARGNRWRRFFEEHGYVFTLMCVQPKTMYTQGLARTWNRRTKEDFHQRELEAIGQQEVLNKEVFCSTVASNDGTWGYQNRYDEYRRTESSIAGEMRTVLNTYHMARIFASFPALNAAFIASNPTNRIYQDTADNQLIVMAHHSIQARRQLSKSAESRIL